MELLGHKKTLNYFQKMIQQGTLHHAYALAGPQHVGKTTLAKHIIAQILNTSVERLPIHPDFLQVERIDEDGKLKRDITVEHIAQVTSKVMMTPLASKQNIILIEDADKMNPYAANALLKTLEEPATPTIFFLLTPSLETLLPTIKSRVHSIELARVPLDLLESECKQFFPDQQNLTEMIEYSHGLPGLILEWKENSELFEDYKKEVERFFALFHKPLYEKIALVEPLFGDKKAHIEGRQELVQTLHIWEHCVQTLITGSRTFPQVAPGTLVPIYDTIVRTISGLGQNIHPRLLVENILLTLP